MPKMKTHRGAAKRFKVTGTGKIRAARRSATTCSSTSPRAAPAGSAAWPRSPAATRSASSACSGEVDAMARVKRSVNGKKHRRAILEEAQGYTGSRSRHFRKANEQVMHSLRYAYRDRRARKGEFRRLWIVRINAACREHDIVVLAVHRRAEGRRGRRRPQDARRPRGARAGGVRRARRDRTRALDAA